MFCPNCGARNAEADTTCQKCGFNLKEAAGAKFKGTMLMMNNPAAADLRRSAPPGGTPPAAGAPGAKPAVQSEAQQMRSKLKGTMIGVAPPAAALLQNQTPAAPAAGYSQPGPGQVNAPGAGVNRGGGTMIGTGIGAPGQFPYPGPGGAAAPPAAPSAHAATELLAASSPAMTQNPLPQNPPQSFGSTYGAGFPNQPNNPAGPAATVRSAVQSHPLAQTQVAAGANEAFPSAGMGGQGMGGQGAPGYPDPTRAMSQFEQQQPQRPLNTLEGTMVAAGSIPPAPRTDSMPHVGPQFSAQAGSRTDTPPMGFPAATAAQPPYASGSGQSKGKTILLTVMTCGLYHLFKKKK